MKVFYDKDADLSLIKSKKVAIIGYGSQGHAHAQNLHDSGVDVVVGVRKNGASWKKAQAAGLTVATVEDAVKAADVVMMLIPDETIAKVYNEQVLPNIREGARLPMASTSTSVRSNPARISTSSWWPRRPPATRCVPPSSQARAFRS